MARFGRYKVQMRKGKTFMQVLMATVTFVLFLYVGGKILTIIGDILNLTPYGSNPNVTNHPFGQAFNLLGYTNDQDGTSSIGTSSLIGIIGIMGAIFIIMQFVQVRRV